MILRLLLAALVLGAHSVNAQNLMTKVETTTTISNSDINSANFLQLISAIKSFQGKELKLDGQLYSNEILEDAFTILTNQDIRLEISLDDGRSITKKARACPSVYNSFDGQMGCAVSLTIELDLGSSTDSYIVLGGVGYDVEFK
jgi:hypothetical protein